jgi:hypothetical protein
VPLRETINGEPGEVWTNTRGRAVYQFRTVSRPPCAACLQYESQLSVGPWPIPLHRECRCMQIRVEPGMRAPHAFADYRKMLDEMSPADRTAAIGKSVYSLLKRGVITWEDAVTRFRVRSLKQIVALKKLSIKVMEENGVSSAIARIAHAAVHTPEQEVVRQARAASAAALEAAGVHREALVEVLAKTMTGGVRLSGATPGAMSSSAGFKPTMSAQARELEAILAAWRPAVGVAIVASSAEAITLRRGAKTVTIGPGEKAFGGTFEEWKRVRRRSE